MAITVDVDCIPDVHQEVHTEVHKKSFAVDVSRLSPAALTVFEGCACPVRVNGISRAAAAGLICLGNDVVYLIFTFSGVNVAPHDPILLKLDGACLIFETN